MKLHFFKVTHYHKNKLWLETFISAGVDKMSALERLKESMAKDNALIVSHVYDGCSNIFSYGLQYVASQAELNSMVSQSSQD